MKRVHHKVRCRLCQTIYWRKHKCIKGIPIIEKTTKQMCGYDAMNNKAAKAMGFPWPYPKDAVVIDKNLHGKIRRQTIIHEKTEKKKMEEGEDYWPAHETATAEERYVK